MGKGYGRREEGDIYRVLLIIRFNGGEDVHG
jgi:hypothetical protein